MSVLESMGLAKGGRLSARASQVLGIDWQTLNNYRKNRLPEADKLLAMAEGLGVSMDWLLTGKTDPGADARRSFAARLARAAEDAGLGWDEIGLRLDLDQSALGRLITGHPPEGETFLLLARLLSSDPLWLATGARCEASTGRSRPKAPKPGPEPQPSLPVDPGRSGGPPPAPSRSIEAADRLPAELNRMLDYLLTRWRDLPPGDQNRLKEAFQAISGRLAGETAGDWLELPTDGPPFLTHREREVLTRCIRLLRTPVFAQSLGGAVDGMFASLPRHRTGGVVKDGAVLIPPGLEMGPGRLPSSSGKGNSGARDRDE